MKIQNIPGSHKQSSRDLKLVTLLFVAAFLVIQHVERAGDKGSK